MLEALMKWRAVHTLPGYHDSMQVGLSQKKLDQV
jgi:hypothetical protein